MLWFILFLHLPGIWAVIAAFLVVRHQVPWQNAVVFVATLTTSLVFLVLVGAAVVRKIRNQTTVKIGKTEIYTPYYLAASSYMAYSVFFGIFALVGVAPTMLLIEVGRVGAENYEWGRWCLYLAILGFSVGTIMFGLTSAFDRDHEWNYRGPEGNPR